MKRFGAGVIAFLSAVSIGGAASAVELRNLDSQNHKVRITSRTLDKEYEFRANSLSLVICVDNCKFDVPGIGTVFATRDDIVTIEPGKVTKVKGLNSPPEPPAKPKKRTPAKRTR